MQCRALSPDQIQRLHEASLSILSKVGVQVPHGEMLRRFADAGAQVDMEKQRVRLPPDLVDRFVAQAGKTFTLYGRDPRRRAIFGEGSRNYNSSSGQAHWFETPGAAARFATLKDVKTAARVGDALEHINVVGAMSDPHDLPAAGRCVEVLATLIRNTTKPVTLWFHDRASAAWIVEMLIALRGNEAAATAMPLCHPFLEPISPLRFPFNGIDLLFETARLNLPAPIGPMAQMGLSAPGTRAGTMALENAEILAGIAITQLIRPGMPVCYGGICHAFDMATTQIIFGGPEQAFFSVAMTQMGKFYGLPVYINAGLTDAKRPDAQAGLETAATLACAVPAGADIYGHLGIAGADQGASLDLLVLQDEVVAYVEALQKELDVSAEALGLDVIEEVGPGGSFVAHEHTAQHFRRELWFPKLLDRQYYQAWLEQGAPSLEERCCERRLHLQQTSEPEPVSADTERALAQVLAAARRHFEKTA